MKQSKLYSLWLGLIAVSMTAKISIQAVFKSFGKKKPTRKWVDDTLNGWVDRLFAMLGITYRVVNPHGVKPLPGKATLIMCNHSSLFDIPLSFKIFPGHSIRMLAKKELGDIPIFGRAMIASEFPFVNRKDRIQAIKDLQAVKQAMESGLLMWIAPEGTRAKDGKLKPFKKGGFIIAIESGATIIPVGIRGAYEILPAKTMQLTLNQQVEIHVGKPIEATDYTLANKEILIDRVHKEMKALLGEEENLST